jgi:hypothetical protein
VKKVFIYSTCQGEAISKILKDSDEFNGKYEVANVVHNYEYIQSQKMMTDDVELFKHITEADVFIYQPLDDIHGGNSTNKIISYLKEDCIKISIPYVFLNSITPFVIAYLGDIEECIFSDAQKHVVRNMSEIRRLINTFDKRQILRLYDLNLIDWGFENRHNDMIKFLRNKEKNIDIKICDYIEENISKKRLFVYYSHPTTDVLMHMTNQICDILKIRHIQNTYSEDHFLRNLRIQYPTSSVKYFNMEFISEEEMREADLYYRNKLGEYIDKINKKKK